MDFLRIFYRGESFNRARGRELLENTRARIERQEGQGQEQSDIFASPPAADENAGVPGREGQRPQPAAAGQAQGKAGQVAAQAAAPSPLDHGELNIPGRTSSINAELDKYEKQQAATAKAKARQNAAETKSDKAWAKELLAGHRDAIAARHGAKFGVRELKHQLDQWAKWEPRKLIAFVEKFKAEQVQEHQARAARGLEPLDPKRPEQWRTYTTPVPYLASPCRMISLHAKE